MLGTSPQEQQKQSVLNEQIVSVLLSRVRQSPYLEQFRSFSEFTSREYFSKPSSYDEFTTRLEMNIKYFAANYLLVGLILLTYTILSSPVLLLLLVGSYFVYKWATNREVVKIWKIELRGKFRALAVGGGLSLLIVLYAGSTVAYMLAITGIFSVAHAVSHESMVDADIEASSQVKMVGAIDDSGDEDAHLAGTELDISMPNNDTAFYSSTLAFIADKNIN